MPNGTLTASVDGVRLKGDLWSQTQSSVRPAPTSVCVAARQWQSALPIVGVDGSIATVQADSPATGQVFAKT